MFSHKTFCIILLINVHQLISEGAVISDFPPFILSSPRITDWGEWGDFEYCPDNTYVRGMKLKTEPAQGPGDDTSLNGISFMCGVIDEPQRVLHNSSRQIQSLVGKWGTWGGSYECPNGYAVGFQLRSEPSQKNQDDTAANNLRIYCSSTGATSSVYNYLEGSGLGWGNWTQAQFCPLGFVICGIRTQVESYKGQTMDDTALNNLDVQCCNNPQRK